MTTFLMIESLKEPVSEWVSESLRNMSKTQRSTEKFESAAELFSIPKYKGMFIHILKAYPLIKGTFSMDKKQTPPKGMLYYPFF